MEFVDVEGERVPYVMHKPFVYSNVVDCSNHFTIFCPNGEVKVIKKKKEYGKEIDVLMRDPKRITPFLADLGTIWTNCCPDWRFGQLISNFLRYIGEDYFYWEEDKFLEELNKYVEKYKSYTEPVLLKDEDVIADIIIDEIMKEINKGGN